MLPLSLRLRDLEGYLHLLQQYTTTSSVLSEWIGATRQKHDALQATKIDSITALDEHLNQQKVSQSVSQTNKQYNCSGQYNQHMEVFVYLSRL